MTNKFSCFLTQKGRWLTATLFILFSLSIGNAWGDVTYKSNYSDFTSISESSDKYMWIPKSVIDEVDWIATGSSVTSGNQKYSIFIDPSTGVASTNTTSVAFYRPKDRTGNKHLTFYLTNITAVSFYAYNSSTGKTLKAKVNGGSEITLATTDNSNKSIIGTITGLSASTNYTIEIYNQNASSGASEVYVGAIKVTPGASCSAPTITTDLSTTKVEYEQNAAATPLAIETSGTSVTYQWYSNTANSATTPTPTALENCTTKTYTPSTSTLGTTYYFCVASSSTCSTTSKITPVEVKEASGGGDTEAPTFVSSVPANSATDVAVSGTIVLTFSEAIASVDDSKFSLSGATIGTVAIDGTDSKKVNVPYSGAANEATVTLSVAADAVADAAGNKSAALSDIAFQTVAAVSYCTELVPATSGDAPAAGGAISLTTATGGSMKALTANISYSANGLLFGDNSGTKAEVTLTHLMQVGTIITATIYNGNDDKARGLNLLNSSGTSKATWTKTKVGDHIETYTVVAGDGLAGSNVFQLQRNQNAYLKDLKVSNCGAELHALTSAIDPVAADGKATITLSKTLVATGATATATYSAIDAAYDFDEWVVSGATIDDAKANPVTVTMGSTDATITLKLKAAAVKYTVHFDSKGGSLVANQSIDAGGHASVPTAPTKFKYTFGGWSETDGGSTPANLSEIAINADKTFYAIWTPKACPTSGTIFSLVSDGTKAPTSNTYYPSMKPGIADLVTYATVSGGIAQSVHATSSNNQVQIQNTTAGMKLSSDDGYIRVLLECPLQEGDTIKLVKDNKIKITFDSLKTAAKTVQLASGTGANKDYYVVTAGFAGEDTIHVRKDGSNVTVTSVKVIRPAHYDVTFNMHGHGDAVTAQNIIKGGKVSEPATTDITGWDFGGWYAIYVADPESYDDAWDFDNDVVSAATELHAKWTEHVASSDVSLKTLSVNGDAVTIVPSQLVYAVELPFGTTATPTVTATANDENVKAFTITQATAVDGSATIYVKAEDNTTEATYTINFSVATSKDIELVWDKTKKRCDDTTPSDNVKSDDASVSAYINKITFTGGGAEGSSLNVGNTTGNMFTLSAKAGYAFQAMSFFGKIQDATCEYSLNGGAWTELESTKTDGDKCYANIFSAAEVHEFRLRSTGTSGVWIRNMQLTIIEACTPIVLAWDEEPVEFEVGKSGYAIAATANNSGAVTYSSTDGDVIAVNGSTGALTVSALGSVTLKATTAEGDGTAYCANGGNDIEISKAVNTYLLVTFDGQNGEAANEVKYYSGDAPIALPAAPTYAGYDFQGWFDAETGGNQYTAAITPTASTTVYAQWVAQCAGATITTQPTGASYLTGRAATALVCEATAGNGGALTYEWFTCDDELKTNPVAATATPSTAVAGTFYYFCKVTEEGCAVEAFSNVVTITVTDKDAICIIKSTPTSGTEATVDGVYQGNAYFKGRAADKKLNSQYDYVGVELASGYTFLATDKVVLNQTAALGTGDLSKFYVYVEEPAGGKAYATVLNASPVQGNNWFTMPTENVGQSTLYVGRVDANCNPSVGYLAVYRACAPILSKITVNSVEGTPDNTNHVTIEVPASTTQTQLEAIAYEWVSNNDAWTAAHDPAAANAWEFGVENTVTFTDKDGDASEYYITVNKAAASTNVELATLTVDGNAITVVPGQDVYEYEYPYGTAETPAPVVAATAEDANAEVGTITQAASKNGTATFTVTAEDGTTYRDYTVNFSVSRVPTYVIFDGSVEDDYHVSGTGVSTFAWEVVGGKTSSYKKEIDITLNGKHYVNSVNIFGSATNSSTRYVEITIPDGYLAKFYLAGATNNSGEVRSLYISKEKTGTLDESIAYSSASSYDGMAMKSDFQFPGTYYMCCDNSIRLYELSVQLYPIDEERAMTQGRFGTICYPNGGRLLGAMLLEIAYFDPGQKKIFFDEVIGGQMVAGAPYLFLPNEGVDKFAIVYTDNVNASAGHHNGLYGSYTQEALPTDGNHYIMLNNQYCKVVEANTYVGANRAYIQLDKIGNDYVAPAYGRRRVSLGVQQAEVATGLEDLNVGDQPIKIMINGQMYILRGEKIYDATGRLVK